MKPVAIDPAEIRTPPLRPKSAARQAIVISIQVTFGLAFLAALFVGGIRFFGDLAEPSTSAVRLARVEDWPEIKNGVPEVVSAKPPVPAHLIPPSSPENQPRTAAEAEPGAAPRSESVAAAPAAPAAPLTEPDVTARADRAVAASADEDAAVLAQLPTPEIPAPLELALSSAAVVDDASRSSTSEAQVAAPVVVAPALPENPPQLRAGMSEPVPLPPRRDTIAQPAPAAAAKAAKKKLEPRPDHKQLANRAGPAPTAEPGPAAPPPEELTRPAEEDRLRVFGLALPGFIPTGRKIKESVQSVGDAVMSLPGRF